MCGQVCMSMFNHHRGTEVQSCGQVPDRLNCKLGPFSKSLALKLPETRGCFPSSSAQQAFMQHFLRAQLWWAVW